MRAWQQKSAKISDKSAVHLITFFLLTFHRFKRTVGTEWKMMRHFRVHDFLYTVVMWVG